jgi:protein arginine N-methyltransferase 1
MYDLFNYGAMIGPQNAVRVEAYSRALARAVTPDRVVLELGSGIGLFALIAARLGARHVYAVEPNPVTDLAREIAAVNGLADRITFIRKFSTDITLPERADVLISDLRGSLPLALNHITSIADARRRLVADGGILIPQRDEIFAVPAEVPEAYQGHAAPWTTHEGLDFDLARRRTVCHIRKIKVKPDQMLAAPQCWQRLDYATITNPSARGTLEWQPSRPGTAHGLCLWFDAHLAEDISFSNAPGQPSVSAYNQLFLPFESPVPVTPSDTITAALAAHSVGDRYVWEWDTTVRDADGSERVRLRQNTLPARLSTGAMAVSSPERVLPEHDAVRIDREVLTLIDGRRTTRQIADELAARFPDRFGTWEDALPRILELTTRYGT